jgi:hypothetical protein
MEWVKKEDVSSKLQDLEDMFQEESEMDLTMYKEWQFARRRILDIRYELNNLETKAIDDGFKVGEFGYVVFNNQIDRVQIRAVNDTYSYGALNHVYKTKELAEQALKGDL